MWDRCQQGDSPHAKTRLFDREKSSDTKRQESRFGPLTAGQNGKRGKKWSEQADQGGRVATLCDSACSLQQEQ
jgi:hypothetical protein